MKKSLLVLLVVFSLGQSISEGSLDYISITPSQPTASDLIELFAGGETPTNYAGLDSTNFSAVGNDLTWDIYYSLGMFQVIDNWDTSDIIGILAPGSYDLTVRVYVKGPADAFHTLDDVGYESFNVTPEPATLVLMALGGLLIRKRN
ncbi:MAG: PEP-CTERM sorting domain-containing protein [Anaerohalosphaeraceae bacterium]